MALASSGSYNYQCPAKGGIVASSSAECEGWRDGVQKGIAQRFREKGGDGMNHLERTEARTKPSSAEHAGGGGRGAGDAAVMVPPRTDHDSADYIQTLRLS